MPACTLELPRSEVTALANTRCEVRPRGMLIEAVNWVSVIVDGPDSRVLDMARL
ncbi:hypothetical protein D9M69_681920 [compost metagenome]